MEMKNPSFLLILMLVITGITLSGCASNLSNLVDKGSASIERIPSGNIYVSRAYVYQDGNEIVIAGKVKRRHTSGISGGHVDIAVVSPEGEILKKVSSFYVPRIIPRKGPRESSFKVRSTIIPPEGSKIRVAHHQYLKSFSKTFDCGENEAIPELSL